MISKNLCLKGLVLSLCLSLLSGHVVAQQKQSIHSSQTSQKALNRNKTMATVTFKKDLTIKLNGVLPAVGSQAPNFKGTKTDLSDVHLEDYRGKRVVLNIFPSVDTGVCAASVRRFNAEASKLENTVVLCISKDLPFAQARFCGAEGLDKVIPLSTFRCNCFTDGYGLLQTDGPLYGLLARAVVVIDEAGKILYTELVPEITNEPNYEAALAALK